MVQFTYQRMVMLLVVDEQRCGLLPPYKYFSLQQFETSNCDKSQHWSVSHHNHWLNCKWMLTMFHHHYTIPLIQGCNAVCTNVNWRHSQWILAY